MYRSFAEELEKIARAKPAARVSAPSPAELLARRSGKAEWKELQQAGKPSALAQYPAAGAAGMAALPVMWDVLPYAADVKSRMRAANLEVDRRSLREAIIANVMGENYTKKPVPKKLMASSEHLATGMQRVQMGVDENVVHQIREFKKTFGEPVGKGPVRLTNANYKQLVEVGQDLAKDRGVKMPGANRMYFSQLAKRVRGAARGAAPFAVIGAIGGLAALRSKRKELQEMRQKIRGAQ